MRRALWMAAVAASLVLPAASWSQEQEQKPAAPVAQTAPEKDDSPAAAARRAREQKKETTKPTKVFDNDNIPTRGGVSAVGTAPAETGPVAGTALEEKAGPESAAAKTGKGDEKSWRKKFADLRQRLETDKQELDVLQRELSVLDLQYYNDPNKAMQQGYTRSDINEKTAKIDAMQKKIQADEQAISDAEDELRRSGGDPGWAR